MSSCLRCTLLALISCLPGWIHAQEPLPLRGFINAHDPSTIIQCKDRYYMFHTGRGIQSSWSTNKIFWSPGPRIFPGPPSWVTNTVPEFNGDFWAPDVAYFSNRYHLYYSVSSWGKQVSAIGLATSPTLDPSDPNYAWTDHGIVIQSFNGSPFNTIDPSITWDAQGNLWMVYGSYWNGIYLVQLNPQTGMRISPNSPTHRLAWNNSIEAACIYRRGGFYYLFVNWGSCCSGVNSTYNVRVGRSTSITGPYRDAAGVDMVNRGGKVFMRASGKYAGPGHIGVLQEQGTEWMSFHYYDANSWSGNYDAYGTAKLGLAPMQWTADAWPVHSNDWSAVYNFDYDARDENGQNYGLLKDGAKVVFDASRGSRVLDLDGTGQYVWMPPALGNAQTVAAVVKWRGGGPWQRIFDFGFDTSRTFMLTPSTGDGALRCDLNTGGNLQSVQWDRPLPSNVWTHVAVTVDGSRGILYVNGLPVATNASMNQLPYSGAFQTNHLGRSKFAADAPFNGQFARLSVHSHALTRQEITAPVPKIDEPAEGSSFAPGQEIRFSGSATDFMAIDLPAQKMTWTVRHISGGTTNLVAGPLIGVTNGVFSVPSSGSQTTNGVYQVTLFVSDNSGRTASKSVTLRPGTASSKWASFYPFTSNGNDASNHYNLLLIGPTIQTDALRGKVLNLSGSSQYGLLPPAAASAQTVSAWVKWRGGNAWQRLFDFGKNSSSWFYFTPKDGSGLPEAALTSDRARFVQTIESTEPFPLNEWTHVAVVADGQQGVLYINGAAVGVNNSLNLLPSDVTGQNAYIGKSQFSDPYLNAQIDSLRLNSAPLTPAELFAPSARIVHPAPGTLFSGGFTLTLSGEALNWKDEALPSTWTVKRIQDGAAQTVLGPITTSSSSYTVPTVGPATTNIQHVVELRVVDTNGLSSTTTAIINPRLSRLSFETVPENLSLSLDGGQIADGSELDLVAGFQRTISAPESVLLNGTNYGFVMWSDGGPASHDVTVPLSNAVYTVSYVEPELAMSILGTNMHFAWPSWAQRLQLHSATNLASSNWVRVTNPVPLSAYPQQFFRLQAD